MGFGRKGVCAAQPQMNFYRFGAFQTIPHPLRGSSLCTREPWVDAKFGFLPQRKQKQKSRFQNRKRQQNKSRALSLSRFATAPSRREPMTARVFSLCRKENRDKIQGSKLKVRTLFFCGTAARHYMPFWEEGDTRKRDGRSKRD